MSDSIQKVLYDYMRNHGISIIFIANKTGIKYELLRRSLKGERILSADEFVKVINALDIDLKSIIK